MFQKYFKVQSKIGKIGSCKKYLTPKNDLEKSFFHCENVSNGIHYFPLHNITAQNHFWALKFHMYTDFQNFVHKIILYKQADILTMAICKKLFPKDVVRTLVPISTISIL